MTEAKSLDAVASVLSLIATPCWLYDVSERTILWGNSSASAMFAVNLSSLACSPRVDGDDVNAWNELHQKLQRVIEAEQSELTLDISTSKRQSLPAFPSPLPPGQHLKALYKPLSLNGKYIAMVQITHVELEDGSHLDKSLSASSGDTLIGSGSISRDDAERMVEMCRHHPMFQFLFNEAGQLLSANKMAMANMHERLGEAEEDHTLQRYISIGEAEGSLCQDEMYHAAMKAIFVDDLPCHRFAQLRASARTPGKFRWVLYEMWPLKDPVTRLRSVLVCEQNITQVKALEDKFKKQNKRLEAQLHEALAKRDGHHRPTIDIDTPTDKTLKLLDKIMRGDDVSAREAIELRDAIISAGGDLRQPVNFIQQVMHSDQPEMDHEVGASLIQLLSHTQKALDRIEEEGMVFEPLGGGEATGSTPHTVSTTPRPASIGHLHAPNVSWTAPSLVEDGGGFHHEIIRLTKNIPDRLLSKLEKVDNWAFDAFELAEAADGRPLSVLGFFLLKRFNLINVFSLDETKLARFLLLIEDGYPDNPYHNRIHAADVLQSLHVILCRGQLMEKGFCDDISLLSCYLSAIIHDYEHKGVNNDYLIRTSDPLAILYNDRSPMENHHLAAAFHQMTTPEYNFMPQMSLKNREAIRRQVIDMVLATDMKQHFSIHSMFQAKTTLQSTQVGTVSTRSRPPSNSGTTSVQQKLSSIQQQVSSMQQQLNQGASLIAPGEDKASSDPVSDPMSRWVVDDDMRSLVLQMGLKCADLGHLTADRDVHTRWVRCLEEEFFRQGDREKSRGVPVSPLMNREVHGITRSQIGFFDIVALPLFQSFALTFPAASPMLEAVKDNYNMWKAQMAAAAGTTSMSGK